MKIIKGIMMNFTLSCLDQADQWRNSWPSRSCIEEIMISCQNKNEEISKKTNMIRATLTCRCLRCSTTGIRWRGRSRRGSSTRALTWSAAHGLRTPPPPSAWRSTATSSPSSTSGSTAGHSPSPTTSSVPCRRHGTRQPLRGTDRFDLLSVLPHWV